ncbi:MAG: polysulfide reductase NrfD [Acidobacteria bacterium]|nr:polysulfide reductase NrfD [Acidobacteriota bacterium]
MPAGMPHYGFAIDLRKCIGCHACTIACKEEHEIPLGVNRCWVKSVEKGTFPDTRRFFFPVLCNQCDDAPCVNICPTRALVKRRDGIVDLHADVCIGCRACMVACPYDQLFIDPGTRTAEKCNFCANRVENQLLPACVSVCPTECRIFGDLDDPTSRLAQLVRHEPITVRKPEKDTGPNVYYIGADQSAIRPEIAARPLMFYKEGQVTLRPLASPQEDPSSPGDPRVDYDVPHLKPWGVDMALYLLTKGIGCGAMLLAAVLWLFGFHNTITMIVAPEVAIVFITITAVILVIDLERPERFYYVLIRPNWTSWMAWGAYFLTLHGVLCGLWLVAGWLQWAGVLDRLALPAIVSSVLATSYTGFLFAQGRARDLWQGPHAAADLLAQAGAEGSAALLLVGVLLQLHGQSIRVLAWTLVGCLAVHLVLLMFENLLTPSATRHHELAVEAIRRGPFAGIFWGGALVGGVLAIGLVAAATMSASALAPAVMASSAVLALATTFAWEYIWVEAGQSVPLS